MTPKNRRQAIRGGQTRAGRLDAVHAWADRFTITARSIQAAIIAVTNVVTAINRLVGAAATLAITVEIMLRMHIIGYHR